jgi:hypothetical protein
MLCPRSWLTKFLSWLTMVDAGGGSLRHKYDQLGAGNVWDIYWLPTNDIIVFIANEMHNDDI